MIYRQVVGVCRIITACVFSLLSSTFCTKYFREVENIPNSRNLYFNPYALTVRILVSLMTVFLQNSFNLFHPAHSLQQGLCHISELSSSWLAKAEDVRKTFGNAACKFFLFKCPMFLGICYSFWLNLVDRLSKLEIVWMLSLLRLVTLFPLYCSA